MSCLRVEIRGYLFVLLRRRRVQSFGGGCGVGDRYIVEDLDGNDR